MRASAGRHWCPAPRATSLGSLLSLVGGTADDGRRSNGISRRQNHGAYAARRQRSQSHRRPRERPKSLDDREETRASFPTLVPSVRHIAMPSVSMDESTRAGLTLRRAPNTTSAIRGTAGLRVAVTDDDEFSLLAPSGCRQGDLLSGFVAATGPQFVATLANEARRPIRCSHPASPAARPAKLRCFKFDDQTEKESDDSGICRT